MRFPRHLLVAVGLIGALMFPQAALASDAQQAEPVVLVAPHKPYWRAVPPTTAPEPHDYPASLVLGMAAIRGTVLHGEGDLLLLDTGEQWAVVRLPEGNRLPASAVPLGTEVEALGLPSGEGILDSVHATLWMR